MTTTDKKREQARRRQSSLRAARAAAGRIRKEYWATRKEHDALVDTLKRLRGDCDVDH